MTFCAINALVVCFSSMSKPNPSPPLLLVENDPLVGRATERALRHVGWDALWAKSAREGAAVLARRQRFPAGVFDIDLGDGSGVDLAVQYLHAGLLDSVVFFTASPDCLALRQAQALGQVVSKARGAAGLLRVLARMRQDTGVRKVLGQHASESASQATKTGT